MRVSRSAFNFGPAWNRTAPCASSSTRSCSTGPANGEDQSRPNAPHEAGRLNLAIEKAFHLLGWSPVWDFDETINKTVDWYRETKHVGAEKTEIFAS